jgi:hypothetical protein
MFVLLTFAAAHSEQATEARGPQIFFAAFGVRVGDMVAWGCASSRELKEECGEGSADRRCRVDDEETGWTVAGVINTPRTSGCGGRCCSRVIRWLIMDEQVHGLTGSG